MMDAKGTNTLTTMILQQTPDLLCISLFFFLKKYNSQINDVYLVI